LIEQLPKDDYHRKRGSGGYLHPHAFKGGGSNEVALLCDFDENRLKKKISGKLCRNRKSITNPQSLEIKNLPT
jgi:hypothetical protein